MSSSPNHETASLNDSASVTVKSAKQEGTTSYSHDSIGARVEEGISYVQFLTGVAQPRILIIVQLDHHKSAVR
jgi:hypothetical protein